TPCGGNASCLSVPVTALSTYHIRIAGLVPAAYTLHVTFIPPVPANDVCVNATVIADGATTVGGTTFAASVDGRTTCGLANTSPDVGSSYTPGCSGAITISPCFGLPDYDSVVSVHSGCPGTAANTLACADNTTCGHRAVLTMNVVAGTNYRIRVSGNAGA